MRIKLLSTLLIVTLLSFMGVSVTSAQCTPATEGDDTIECTGAPPERDYSALGGDDTLTNNGTVIGAIEGNAGDDTIINGATGATQWIDGNDGNDTIINNGGVAWGLMGYDGDDTLVNNGGLGAMIAGMNGNDTVILNTATASSNGDYHVGLDGGAGTDTLQFDFYTQTDYDAVASVLTASDPAGGEVTINGVNYTWLNFEQLLAILQATIPDYSSGIVIIPAGGAYNAGGDGGGGDEGSSGGGETGGGGDNGSTIIIITIPVPQPEQPQPVTDGRLNATDSGSVALFCAAGGYEAYSVEGQTLINVDPVVVAEGLASAVAQQQNLLLGENGPVTLWALFTNEIQIQDDTSGYIFIIDARVCSG